MINEIIDAISIALDSEFEDGYKIHKDEIKQDLKEPCFFIQLIICKIMHSVSSTFLNLN